MDISEIIASGTAKEKVLMLTEDVAKRKSGMTPLLSEESFQSLLSSISRPSEVRLYNRFRKIDHTVTTGLYVLNQSRVIYRMHISDLRGYALLWESYQRAEELANLILHEVKNDKERGRIAGKALSHTAFLLAEKGIDNEGYVEIKANHPQGSDGTSLIKAIGAVKKDAEKELSRTLAYAQALLDYMNEKDFKVPTYREKVEDLLKDIKTDKAVWRKYSSYEYNSYVKKRKHPLRELERQGLYAIFPDPEEVKMDTAAYHHFKKHVVGYE